MMLYMKSCGTNRPLDWRGAMHLSRRGLFQMNHEWLTKLPAELLLEASKRRLHDTEEFENRLNQHADNSSRPPTSQAP